MILIYLFYQLIYPVRDQKVDPYFHVMELFRFTKWPDGPCTRRDPEVWHRPLF